MPLQVLQSSPAAPAFAPVESGSGNAGMGKGDGGHGKNSKTENKKESKMKATNQKHKTKWGEDATTQVNK